MRLSPTSIFQRFRYSPRWIYPILIAMLIVICTVVGSILVAARQNDMRRASTESANIAAALAQDIGRNLELYDLSLQGALEAMRNPTVMAAPEELRRLVLFDRAATAPYLGQILVLDDKGNVIADSSPAEHKPTNYSDRDYFRIHAQRPGFGLYVSRPLVARADGEQLLALSRRIDNADGSFGGVVVGTVRISYFHALFRQIRVGAGDSLTLFRNDGTIIMREPYDPEQVGMRIPPLQLFDLAARSAEGEYQAVSALDGVNRLYHYRRVGGLPLIQSVGFSLADIYASWWRRAALIASVLGACCLIIVALTVFLHRELRRRSEAENAYRALADRDSLTGLGNRRCFDRTIEAEWRRAGRDGRSLGLLLIDADQFKLFNDSLGHGAGDEALIQLARCMAACARRPGDLAARYGGEEFALILPETDAHGAMTVAETLREAVYQLGVPHPKSLLGRFTVSIGVASMVPAPAQSVADLIRAADEALYQSKSSGRNRSNWDKPPATPLRLAS